MKLLSITIGAVIALVVMAAPAHAQLSQQQGAQWRAMAGTCPANARQMASDVRSQIGTIKNHLNQQLAAGNYEMLFNMMQYANEPLSNYVTIEYGEKQGDCASTPMQHANVGQGPTGNIDTMLMQYLEPNTTYCFRATLSGNGQSQTYTCEATTPSQEMINVGQQQMTQWGQQTGSPWAGGQDQGQGSAADLNKLPEALNQIQNLESQLNSLRQLLQSINLPNVQGMTDRRLAQANIGDDDNGQSVNTAIRSQFMAYAGTCPATARQAATSIRGQVQNHLGQMVSAPGNVNMTFDITQYANQPISDFVSIEYAEKAGDCANVTNWQHAQVQTGTPGGIQNMLLQYLEPGKSYCFRATLQGLGQSQTYTCEATMPGQQFIDAGQQYVTQWGQQTGSPWAGGQDQGQGSAADLNKLPEALNKIQSLQAQLDSLRQLLQGLNFGN